MAHREKKKRKTGEGGGEKHLSHQNNPRYLTLTTGTWLNLLYNTHT